VFVNKGPATFSVPKSVSLYLAETGDKSVEAMICESFQETMAELESRMETRVRGRGSAGKERNCDRTTGNLVFAALVHRVSRPGKCGGWLILLFKTIAGWSYPVTPGSITESKEAPRSG
jgi:hypothetical protein